MYVAPANVTSVAYKSKDTHAKPLNLFYFNNQYTYFSIPTCHILYTIMTNILLSTEQSTATLS